MIVAFQTEQLRDICEDEDAAAARFGHEVAANLRERLADLRAASTIDDLLAGHPHVSGVEDELLTIDLEPGMRMTWTPNHVTPRSTSIGMIDWSKTTRIRLLHIEER